MTAVPRALTYADIPAAMRIQESAGWNQTAADWHTLLRLAPETSFALDRQGALAATATAICYGSRLAWIGMVLTHPEHRRQGLARLLVRHAVEALIARRIEWIKLDATEMGVPLYRQLGFEPESAIERWMATAAPQSDPPPLEPFSDCSALDLRAFGADRSRLLAALAPNRSAEISGVSWRAGNLARSRLSSRLGEQSSPSPAGYAMWRPGAKAAYFGPCVSRDFLTVRQLLAWFLASHPGQPVYWDLLQHNRDAVALAGSHGFRPLRRLVRMVRPGVTGAIPLNHDHSQVFAIAGFEYG